MEFRLQITIAGKTYTHVKTQRSGFSAIYKDETTFLRIGDKEKIKKDLAFHKKMEAYSFPVPKIISEGEFDNFSYFIEESVGDEHFGIIFKRETEKFGQIQDETFDQFITILVKFAEAQLRTIITVPDWDSFSKGIHLDYLILELPAEKDVIIDTFNLVKNKLSVFPFGLVHGDLTTFNIFPKGIIDFEDQFLGPVGYDIGAVVEHLNWFPEDKSCERFRSYNFSFEQKRKLVDRLDEVYLKHNLPKISNYLADFDFMKGIWFTVRMNPWPKLQAFRYKLMRSLIKNNNHDIKK